jgi:hypothetical protein
MGQRLCERPEGHLLVRPIVDPVSTRTHIPQVVGWPVCAPAMNPRRQRIEDGSPEFRP